MNSTSAQHGLVFNLLLLASSRSHGEYCACNTSMLCFVVAECKDTPNMEICSCLQKQHNMSHMGCTLWTPGCVSGYAAVCCTAVRHRTAGMMRYNGSTSVILAFHQQLDISLRWAQVCSGLLSGEVLPQTVAVRPSDSGAATGCACHTSSSTRSSTRGSNISSTATGGNGSWGAA